MPLGRRPTRKASPAAQDPTSTKKEVFQEQRDYSLQTCLPRMVLCGFDRDRSLALLL